MEIIVAGNWKVRVVILFNILEKIMNNEVKEILIDLINASERQAQNQIVLLHNLAERAKVALRRDPTKNGSSSTSVDPFALDPQQLELKLEEEW